MLVVVTIVVEVVVLVHYEQTGTAKIRVVGNHQVLQKLLPDQLVTHSSSEQKALDKQIQLVIMADRLHLMI